MDSWVETKQLPVHFVSAAGLVWKDGKVLLIRSQRRGWEIPGGVVEQGEIILDGLKREIREESGVEAEPRRLGGIYQRLNLKPGFGPLEGMMIPTTVNLFFVCDYVAGTPARPKRPWRPDGSSGGGAGNGHFPAHPEGADGYAGL